MSKKMLKRSLALGALMAFVITGSAMAASGNSELNLTENTIFDKSITGSLDLSNYIVDTNTDTNSARLYGISTELGGFAITLKDNSVINIIADNEEARAIRLVGDETTTLTAEQELKLYATTNKAQYAVGLAAYKNDKVTVNDIVIDVTNNNTDNKAAQGDARAIALEVDANSEFTANGIANITAQGNAFTQAIYANTGGKIIFNGDVTISSISSRNNAGDDSDARAINLEDAKGTNQGTTITFKGSNTNINSTANAGKSVGVMVSGGAAKTDFTNSNVRIIVSSKEESIGVFVAGDDSNIIANNNFYLEASAENGDVYGIWNTSVVDGDETYKASNVELLGSNTIIAESEGTGNAYGIYGKGVAAYNLADATITATSKEGIAYGVYAKSEDTTVGVVGDLTITATGDKVARGIEAREGSSVTVGTDAKTNNVTINAVATNENAAKDWVIGVFSRHDGSEVDIKGDTVTINATATGTNMASGIVANTETTAGTAKLDIDANNIIITAEASTDGKAAAITTMSGSETTIKGNLTATADKVIYTRGNAKTVINESGKDTVVLNGDIAYAKGYETESEVIDAEVIINLNNAESALNGSIYAQDLAGNASETLKEKVTNGTTLALSNGATWTVKENSFVNTLVGDGGNVKVDMTVAGEVAQVEVMSTEIDSSTVSNLPTNLSNVAVSGTAAVTDYIAKSEDKEAAMQALASSVKTKDGKQVDSDGTYTTDESAIAGAYTFNVDGNEVTYTQAANQTNTAIGESAVALKAHWRAHMNDMNKRMGELRMANGETGVWTRMVRGEAEYESAKMQYNQYQLGYDEKLSVDKRWTVGAAVTFSEGDSSFYKGSTEDDSTAFAIYGSKLNNDGTYVDLIARYARLESDITTATDKSDYSTNGMSVSAEFGKRIEQGNGLWIEPQFELTYGSVDSAEYVLDGKNVQVGDMDSLIGRLGFSIGKDIEKGNVYARASYLYDFDGETETTFSAGGLTDTIKEDLGGGWWEVGVGANINLSKATYIYADVEKTFGGEVDTNWQWNLGVRYSF